MLIAIWPLIIAIVGLVLYLATDGKASEAGRLAFFSGLLVTTYLLAGHTLHVG